MLIRKLGLVTPPVLRVSAYAAVVFLASVACLGATSVAHAVMPHSTDLVSPSRLQGANNPHSSTVMVVGDSVPAELMDTINKEAKKRDLNLVPVAFGGCSVVGLYQLDETNHPFTWSGRCTTAPRIQTQAIKTYDPQLVIWYSGREKMTVCMVPTKDGCAVGSKIYASGTHAQHALVEKAMVTSFKRLTSKGAKLVIVLPTPRGLTATGSCAAEPTSGGCAQNPQGLGHFVWMEKAYKNLAAAYPMKIKTVTMADLLCPGFDLTTGCPAAMRAGSLIRLDGVHIAPSQEQWFVRNLFDRIQATGLLP